jgi:hypothetical protein
MNVRTLFYGARTLILTAGAAAALALGDPSIASAHSWLGQCTVNFDNTFALTNVYANARSTFAFSTAFNSSSKLDLCQNAANPGVCWTYRHRCFSNYVNVDDISGYGHYHLSFTGPGFDPLCGFVDPGDGYGSGFGKNVNGSCVTPNWKTEPRVLDSHDGGQWISIQMHPQNSTTVKTTFDLSRIHVGGSNAIQLWFHSVLDGGWYGWGSMAPNNWDTSASSHDIDEVRISGTSSLSYRIEDFDILD